MLSHLAHFRDRRLVTVFLFGIASGLPWIMIGSVMSAWLKDEGLSRSTIGLFGAIFAVYSFNFLWSPLIDKLRLPGLGRRRSWIFLMQAGVVGMCLLMTTIDAQTQLASIAAIGFAIALFSATQDIAIDAYRIDIIGDNEKEKLSAASSLATAGWWTGYGGLGAIPFFVADSAGWPWSQIYGLLALMMALLMVATWLAKEPTIPPVDIAKPRFTGIGQWLYSTLIAPFQDFFSRNGVRFALSILLFIFLFKIGEAFLGRMSIVFYKEIGFSNGDIGLLSKLLNWWVTILFSIIGGLVNIRYGIYRGLMIAGIAMAASNLMFSLIAEVGPNKWLFAATVIVDGFTASWSAVAMVAFISLLCNKQFSATQYALMASLSVSGRTLLASSSGFLVDWLNGNWSLFFMLTALMVIPALLFLRSIKQRIVDLERSNI